MSWIMDLLHVYAATNSHYICGPSSFHFLSGKYLSLGGKKMKFHILTCFKA